MGYLPVLPGIDLPTGGRIGLDLEFWTDLQDELVEIRLYPADDPGNAVDLPGLWYGQTLHDTWREERQRIEGGHGELVHDQQLAPVSLSLKRLLLSDNTIQNPISGGISAGLDALGDALGTDAGPFGDTRTVFDDIQEIKNVFHRVDGVGAPIIWEIESTLTDTFEINKIKFQKLSLALGAAEDWAIVTLHFTSFDDYPLDGEGL